MTIRFQKMWLLMITKDPHFSTLYGSTIVWGDYWKGRTNMRAAGPPCPLCYSGQIGNNFGVF